MEPTLAECELEIAAWEAWSAAWDATREADKAAGRRYDKDRQAEAAHAARMAVLKGGAKCEAE